jgi:hypothetical protein
MTLFFQGLTFSAPQTWSFTGRVTEVRQVELFGKPATLARVRSTDFETWVIQRLDAGRFEVILGRAQPGDQVRVSVSGAHVSSNGVDWELCQPVASNYCRLGNLYEAGPVSLDWHLPVSPSNEFIHFGQPNPAWQQGLFWQTEILQAAQLCQSQVNRPRPVCPQEPR